MAFCFVVSRFRGFVPVRVCETRSRLGVLTVAALAIWGMKRYYSDAGADDLGWILGPTARLVGVVTRARFVAAPGEGYFSPERLFLIEKSCAGINFMIAAFGMLTFARLHRVERALSGARVLAVSVAASYAAAVIVNATRITIAMWLAAHPVARSTFTAAEVHRVEGIAVYFGGLALLYQLASGSRRMLLPLVWYYAVTLVIPIANGASLSDASFVKHALVVLVLPVLLIGAAYAIRALARAGTQTCAVQRARASAVTISYWNRTNRYSSLSSSRS